MSETLEIPDIVRLVRGDEWRMQALRAVAALGLPDSWIGAGFVRNLVWDRLHGYDRVTPLNDVDVLYFEHHDLSLDKERRFEKQLERDMPGVPWSVRNQARMHEVNGDPRYRSSKDAMRFWPETATSVAVRLGGADTVDLFAAHGIRDLVNLDVRPTPHFASKPEIYRVRVRMKRWDQTWPLLTIRDMVDCSGTP